MSHTPDIYFSFFMFTTNLHLDNANYCALSIKHIRTLNDMGYAGFELPIGRPGDDVGSFDDEITSFSHFKKQVAEQGLSSVKFATNVGATPQYDPSSHDPIVRERALAYLKSRIDITAALGGEIMMGPLIVPYAAYLVDAGGNRVWSDQLQDELQLRYKNAQPVLNTLGRYAQTKNVKLAIEPISHWETPAPNKLSQLIEFLKGVPCSQVGAVIDSAHETLDGDGPEVFAKQVKALADAGRLHYAQASPPDRGALKTSWIPWQGIFSPILQAYKGPVAVEIFNAIPEFIDSLRLTRRKFWIPGLDEPNDYPSAYDVARDSFEVTTKELCKAGSKLNNAFYIPSK